MDEHLLEVVEEKPASPKKPAKQKEKKRPSDFEIIRTILTRTTERKLPFLLKNLGEDNDVFLLVSEEEGGFTYGSSELTIAMLEFDDPELRVTADTVLSKLHGYNSPHQVIVNIRDQISELAKTKGEALDVEVTENDHGSAWFDRADVRGQVRTVYYSRAIESLYHFQMIRGWCERYRFLLQTNQPEHLYYPYSHPDGETYTSLVLPAHDAPDHPLYKLYPNGFRMSVTRGIDLLITKQFKDFPYPVKEEEIIIFLDHGSVCQMAHRVVGDGWRMILLRPNARLFSLHANPLCTKKDHKL